MIDTNETPRIKRQRKEYEKEQRAKEAKKEGKCSTCI